MGLAESVCLGTDSWRVASIETWQLIVAGKPEVQQVRVWRSVSPIGFAHGPLDTTIPVVVVAATEIDSLGWCAPVTGPEAAVGPIQVTAWRVADDGASARPIPIRRVAPIAGDTPYAALYREVTDCVVGFGCSGGGVPLLASSWAPGRYVFRYATGDRHTWWFGADVQVLPQRPPAP